MNEIVDRHPRVVEVDAQVLEVALREELFRRSVVEARRLHSAELEKHHAAVDKAFDSGKVPPSRKPEPPISQEEIDSRMLVLHGEREALREQRMRVLGEIRPEVEMRARAVEAEVMGAAGEHVESLRGLARRLQVAQQAMTEVAGAQAYFDRQDPYVGAGKISPPEAASPESLVHAVVWGTDLLTVGVPRRLGMSGSNLHQPAATAWEPPIPPK